MTYAALLNDETVESNHLAVVKPRRQIASTAWTNTTGTIYSTPFAWGDVIALTSDGVAKTLGTSTAPGSGEWFWDSATELLYVNLAADPDTKTVVATYELYVATKGVLWHRVPTDTASRVVYFEPIISSVPTVALSATDAAFGYIPSQSSSMTLSNDEHTLELHLYDSSFSLVDVDLYHWIDAVNSAPNAVNMRLIYPCLCQGAAYQSGSVTLEMTDRNEMLNAQFRSADTKAFYTLADFPFLDLAFENRPIRQIYGPVNGVVGVNVSYLTDSFAVPTYNRKFAIMKGRANLATVTTTVVEWNHPYDWAELADSTGIEAGDTLAIYRDSGPLMGQGLIVREVDHATHHIRHDAGGSYTVLGGSGPTYAQRSFVRSGKWADTEEYISDVVYGRHYLIYEDATNDVAGVQLSDDFGTGHAAAVGPNSQFSWNVHGHANTTTLGGSAFGANAGSGALTQGVVVLFDLLKKLGVPETQIDTTGFAALQAAVADEVGFAIPRNSTEDFPIYRDMLGDLLQTLLLKLFVDFDGKWTVTRTGPLAASTKTFDANEIMDGSISYKTDFREVITLAQVEYGLREIGTKRQAGTCDRTIVSASSNLAKRVHGIERQKTFMSLHFNAAEASALAQRLAYIFGDRQGRLSVSLKNRFFDADISDVVTISREALPGFEYVLGTARTRDMIVVGTSKSLAGVDLELDDQKGIEDNAGSW